MPSKAPNTIYITQLLVMIPPCSFYEVYGFSQAFERFSSIFSSIGLLFELIANIMIGATKNMAFKTAVIIIVFTR
jgi:hypothetical protein